MRRWILLVTIFLFISLYFYHSHHYKSQAQDARYKHDVGILTLEGEVEEQIGKNVIVRVSKGLSENERILLRLSEDQELGAYIVFQIDLSERQFRSFKNHHFDYDRYLYSKGITKAYQAKSLSTAVGGGLYNSIRFAIRKNIERMIQTLPHAELLKALVLGSKSEYEYYDRFQKLGISHLLVISGLHFSIVYGIVRKLTNVIRNKYLQSFLCICAMLALYAIVNNSYSAMRAVLTVSIMEIQRLRRKRADILVSQSICMICILLAKPYAVLSTSLHLSFFTYILIAFGFKRMGSSKHKLLSAIQSSFFIQIATIPITIYYFGEINLFSMVANLLCVPIFGALVPLALATILLSPVPLFSNIIIAVWKLFVHLLEFLVDLSPLKLFVLNIASFEIFVLCLIIMLLTYVFRFLRRKKWAAFVCVLLLIIPIPLSFVEVIVPDVGHGDVTYIRVGGIAGLIDTGDGKMDVVSFLKSKGIRYLDYLVITHAHKDHVGGLHKLLNEISVQKIYLTDNSLNKLKQHSEVEVDERFCNVKSNLVQKFSKGKDIITLMLHRFQSESDENDNGITVQIESNAFRCAVFGDASTHIIEGLGLQGKYDFIKVGHHGSHTSTSKQVYGELEIAFLAVSHSTKYGNPDEELLRNVDGSRNTLYSTYYHGELRYDGRKVDCYLDKNGKIVTTFRINKVNN